MWVLIAVPVLALIACVCVGAIYLVRSADRHRIGELFAPLQGLIDRVESSARTAEWKTENPVGARIGSDGGEIVGPDGVTLIVPEGALPGETEIRVAQVTELSVQPPGALSFGTAYEIVAPPDTQFMFPVEVYLPFVRQPDLGDEYCSVYRWDGQAWYDLGGVIEGDRIRVHVTKFSIVGTWYTSLSRARLLFVNQTGERALVYPWAWNTEDRLYKGGYAFTGKEGLFGPGITWGDERFPFGTYYSWCVEWPEWTEPVWDLHGGGYWTEYEGTYHMFLNAVVTLSKDSPGGDYVALTRVTFAVTNGIKGVCGEPPGLVQIPPTPTAIAAATSTPVPTATPPATATPVPAATLTFTPPATASATPATPTSTPTFTSTATPSATSTTRSIQVIEEIVKGTQNEPDLIIWANPEHQSPPDGIQIEYAPNTIPYAQWRLLHQEGEWIEATFTLDTAAIGVQFTGDKWCGIGRVLVDGEEVWSGDTYGPWPDGPGYNVYIRVAGLGPGSRTIRVENPGLKGPNSLDAFLHVYFFGLDYP